MQAPARIVTLAVGSGEIVAAMGGGDRVVGRDETSSSPEIVNAPIVTSGHSINAEQIISLTPDVVVFDALTGPTEVLDQLIAAGINLVEVPEAFTINEVEDKTRAIGEATGAPEAAIDYVVSLSTGGQSAGGPEFPVGDAAVIFLYLRGTAAIYLLGGQGSGADDLITASGARDLGAAEGFEAFTPLTAEEIVNVDPNVILVMTEGLASVGGIDGLLDLPGVAQTRAASNRAVVAVDDTLLLSFGPRTTGVVQALHEAWEKLSLAGP